MNQDYQDLVSALDADIKMKSSIREEEDEILVDVANQADLICQAAELGDVGAPFEETALAALVALKSQDKPSWMRIRTRLKKAGVGVTELDRQLRGADDSTSDTDQGAVEKLINLARSDCEFTHNAQNEAYAVFEAAGARQVYRLTSTGFSDFLSHLHYAEYDRAPSEASMKVALATLRGQAQFEGDAREVYTRIAKTPAGYWLDLCNDAWECILITATGWSVMAGDGTPLFTRTSSMRELPIPQTGGMLDDFWPLVNIPELDRPFVLTWMLESLRSDTPHVVLELTGEQGSVKSTTQKFLRRLIDPNQADLRATPKSVEDVWIAAGNSHMVSLENLSHLPPSYQDALCILATGGGYSTRTLYTNADETILDLRKPIVLNGISVIVTAQDLLDRCIHIDLPVIKCRELSGDIEARFAQAQPKLLGALLDLFVNILAVLPKVLIAPEDRPRMADYAMLGEAVFRTLGKQEGEFLLAYNEKRKDGVHRTIDASPVGAALLAYLSAVPSGWNGTLTDLLQILERYRPQGEAWPRSAKGLGDSLRRLAPALRQIGYECISLPKIGGTIRWHIFSKPQLFKPSPACPACPDENQRYQSNADGDVGDVGLAGRSGHGSESFSAEIRIGDEVLEDSEVF